MSRLEADVEGKGVARADVVIEAIVERLEVKRSLFAAIEPRLKPGGKYEMATLDLRQEDRISSGKVRRLTKEVVALNTKLGDPTLEAKHK